MPTRKMPNTPVTMEMIAQRCGVHCSTVQRALKQSRRISEKTAARIREVATEMGYDPALHQAAARLISLRHGTRVINHVIGLYLPTVFYQHNYYLRIMRGILEELVPARFDMLTTCMPDNSSTLPISVVSGGVDGMLAVVDPVPAATQIAALRATPYFGARPIVSLIHPMPGCLSVMADDYAGAYAACMHLLELGHRRILYPLSDQRDTVLRARRRGFHDAYAAYGLDADALFLDSEIPGRGVPLASRYNQYITEMMQTHPDITAILLPNDIFAFRTAQMLAHLGLRVPDDISLVGFDDTEPLLDAHGTNILTTVSLPLEEIGREGARMLLAQVRDENPPEADLTLPASLVVRGSTAPRR